MGAFSIRIIGDPVLAVRAREITDIDGQVAKLAAGMVETLHRSDSGIGLAAPQVGVQRRLFVSDVHDEPQVLVNPEIRERRGEATYQEGCLSIPGLWFDITRPAEVLLVAYDLDGNEVEIEADGVEARLFQHELDHLDGVLMTAHLDEEQSRQARQALRQLQVAASAPGDDRGAGLRLP